MSTNGYNLLEQIRVEIDASDLANLVTNHSGQTGTSVGWAADTNVTLSAVTNPTRLAQDGTTTQTLQGSYTGGKTVAAAYGASAAVLAETRSPSFAVVPGKYVGYQVSAGDPKFILKPQSLTFSVQHQIRFYDSGGLLSSSTPATYQFTTDRPATANAPWLLRTFGSTSVVPAGAVTARVALIMYDDVPGGSNARIQRTVYLTKLMVVAGDTQQDVQAVPFTDATVWQNITGTATSARVVRGGDVEGVVDDIDVGTLTVSILDASLDPARSTRARRGRRFRLTVNTVASGDPVFVPIFTGRISEISADYASTKGQTAATYRPRLTITAVDSVAELRGVPAPYAHAGTLEQKVRQLMALTTVAFVTDTPATTGSTARTSVQEDAQVWDQLVLARNSFTGAKLYVRQDGTLDCRTLTVPAAAAAFSAASGAALSFTAYTAQLGTKSLINSLLVTRHNTSEPDGAKTYGPFQNASSVAAWGTSSADLDVVDGIPATLATWYLARFANPSVVVSEVKFNATKTLFTAGTPHLLELYQTVSFSDPVAGVSGTFFVVGIEQEITPNGWLVTLKLRPADVSSSVTITNGSGGSDAGPADLVAPQPGILGSRNQSALSIADSTWTSLSLDDQVANDGGITWDPTNRRWTVPKAGRYLIAAAVTWPAGATARRIVRVVKNADTTNPVIQTEITPGTERLSEPASRTVKLAAGDTIAVQVFQTTGVAVTTLANPQSGHTWATLTWIGD